MNATGGSTLVDRRPEVSTDQILADLVPPPHFRHVSFDSYIPGDPTQEAAVAALRVFAERIANPAPARRSIFRRAAPPEGRAGVYLDGGFGVGKTHLLASLWQAVPGPKTYGTFVEYTNLVGLLGFRQAVEALKVNTLVCIDEFELDDPGDTVLMSTLLGELVSAGVYLAATSNTLPEKLGEGRFAAEDFLREIQGLSAHFDVLRIDGEDYRHRGAPDAPAPLTDEQVLHAVGQTPGASVDDFRSLIAFLPEVHPSRYGALVDGVPLVGLLGARTLADQGQALRLVVLIDRLYDRDVPVVASGVPLDTLFSEQLLTSGYRKKYFRAISRVVALARAGQSEPA
ncbi:MAG TPA: cell division protein ZapE [Candidatus Nanopelagicales bacterium]|nr:cell division protein ZapE [Candidatus Nanopelagicales bacterium]